MNKLKVIIVCIFVLIAIIYAQQPVKRRPVKFELPNEYNDFTPVPDSECSDEQPWEVYCGEDGAQTFQDVNKQNKYKAISFLDKFYVGDESRDLVRLFKADDYNEDDFVLINPVDWGWISKDKLFLSSHCVVNSEFGGINKKAMIINKKELLKENNTDERADVVIFRKGPGHKFPKSQKESKLFRFFFIFNKKIVNNTAWYLLGKSARFSDYRKDDVVFGWVSGNRLVPWDSRVVVEPNWESLAVKERILGKKAVFFDTPVSLEKYIKTGNIDKTHVIWMEHNIDKPVFERPNGEWRRFALLDPDPRSLNNHEIRAGIQGQINAEDFALLDDIEHSDLSDKLVRGSDSFNNVNIVFVVDGTKSMKPYFKAVSNALSKAVYELSRYYSTNSSNSTNSSKIKFGAAVYRDMEEGYDKSFELKQLTKDPDVISNWLNNTGKRVYYKKDISFDEDLLPGIERTLKDMNLNENETNLLILLGDAGSHPKDKDKINQIAELLIKFNFRSLFFRVNDKVKGQKFEEQLIELGTAYAKLLYNIDKKSKNKSPKCKNSYNYDDYRVNFDEAKNYQNIVAKCTSREFRIYNNGDGKFDNPNSLVNEITAYVKDLKLVGDVHERVTEAMRDGVTIEDILKNIESYGLTPDNKYVDTFEAGMYRSLYESGISAKESKFLNTGGKFQLYSPGFSVEKVPNQKYPLYKKLLFVSNREVSGLVGRLDDLLIHRSKEELLKFMIAKANIYFGEKNNKGEIKVEDILKKMNGIANSNSILGKYTIEEIGSLTNKEFRKITKFLEGKFEEISKISDSDTYRYSFKISDTKYYWVPVDVLP